MTQFSSGRRLLVSAAVLAFGATAAFAQSVVSARSGTLHYFDGSVTLNDAAVEQHPGKFPVIPDNGVLRTALGRAEILLTPGVFLRLGENSAIRMLDTRLLSTRVEFLEGSAMIESDNADTSVKDSPVTIIYKGYEIQPVKFGLFEISSDSVRVYKGQATVAAGGNRVVVKDGRQLPFSVALLTEKLDEKNVDDLYLWTRDRSSNLSAANMASARSVAGSVSGFGANGVMMGNNNWLASGVGGGAWYYNPFLGMYTFMPRYGTVWSPFGYGYFSPSTIYSYYSPDRYYWNGGGTARNAVSTGVPMTNIGTSGVAASQVARLGAGLNTHPTLSSPIRPADVSMGSGFRGMDPMNSGGNFGGGGMYGAQSAGAGRGFDNGAVSGRFGGNASAGTPATATPAPAPVSAPPAGPPAGGGPGGVRGR
ncbi:MAG: hypothetical protein JWN34_6286 [Bryobacterales bacterium]|nr:hypothetical protein [Bryobacterales bacterium]